MGACDLAPGLMVRDGASRLLTMRVKLGPACNSSSRGAAQRRLEGWAAEKHTPAFSRHEMPESCIKRTLEKRRAQGKPDAGCTRGLVCSVESTRVRNHRLNRSDPAFPAQWLTAYNALSPVSGL